MGKKLEKKPLEKNKNIGFSENVDNRKEALKMLDKLTGKRALEGWVWIKRGQTQKQIHPEKLDSHLTEGWKRTKPNESE